MDPIEVLNKRRDELQSELDKLLETPTTENRSFTEQENTRFDEIAAEIRGIDDRVTELRDLAKRQAAANEARKLAGEGEQRGNLTVNEPDIYIKGGENGNSYFRDLGRAVLTQDRGATERLHRNAQAETEKRALGNTNAAGGSGGEFAPPGWLVDEWVNLIRPGRITADLFRHESVPAGVSSVNIPKITGGTTTAIQSSQNSALSQTDMTTGYVQTGFSTIGGKQVVSQQLLDQSAINFDRLIMSDLAADYAQRVGTQVYTGTGAGTGTNAVINGLGAATIGSTQTWTQASPTITGFYGQCSALLAKFLAARLSPPTCWVMAPRRWYYLCSTVDGNTRPLVLPNGNAFNPIATQTNPAAPMGMVGTFLGLPVYIDPLLPTNVGGGTNQDNVYLLKTDDLILFESQPQTEAFRETYADTVGVLFRMFAYVGTMLNRHPESLGVVTGTGLVAPTFAS